MMQEHNQEAFSVLTEIVKVQEIARVLHSVLDEVNAMSDKKYYPMIKDLRVLH